MRWCSQRRNIARGRNGYCAWLVRSLLWESGACARCLAAPFRGPGTLLPIEKIGCPQPAVCTRAQGGLASGLGNAGVYVRASDLVGNGSSQLRTPNSGLGLYYQRSLEAGRKFEMRSLRLTRWLDCVRCWCDGVLRFDVCGGGVAVNLLRCRGVLARGRDERERERDCITGCFAVCDGRGLRSRFAGALHCLECFLWTGRCLDVLLRACLRAAAFAVDLRTWALRCWLCDC